MYPKIIRSKEYKGIKIWELDNGNIATCFKVDLSDLERVDRIPEIEQAYEQFFESIDERLITRVQLFSDEKNVMQTDYDLSRINPIRELGFTENTLLVSLELNVNNIFSRFTLKNPMHILVGGFSLSILERVGLNPEFITEEEYRSHFLKTVNDHYRKDKDSLDFGDHVQGVVKLKSLTEGEFDSLDVSYIKDRIPKPFIYSVTIQKRNLLKAESTLEYLTSAKQHYQNREQELSHLESEEALNANKRFSKTFFDLDIAIILKAQSNEELRYRMKTVCEVMRPIGKFMMETYGNEPAYKGHLLGHSMHSRVNDQQDHLSAYMPLFSYTNGLDKNRTFSGRELVFHRLDNSLCYHDLFDKKHSHYCSLTIAKPGKGKSYLSKQSIRSHLKDKTVHVVKVDVGGNSSQDVMDLGGVEYSFDINKPTNLNPFAIFKDFEHRNSICAALSTLVYKMILESEENELPKDLQIEVDKCIHEYSKSRPNNPCLTDYINKSPNHPRIKILRRWTEGILENTFSHDYVPQSTKNRFQYFNMKSIVDAGNSNFSNIVFATVLTLCSYSFIIYENDLNRKFILELDEIPVFIKSCFYEIKQIVANGRKNKQSVNLIIQKEEQAIINGDKSLLSLFEIIFMFNQSEDKSRTKELFNLTEEQYESLGYLTGVKNEYSTFVMIDSSGFKTVRLISTPKEAWELTSEKHDRAKIEDIKALGYTQEEAIEFLISVDKRRA